jgi:molybdate/tungstate transport system permease protein
VLSYHPMVAPILIFERLENYGLKYASPVAVILILLCLIVFTGLRWLARQRREV